MNDGIVFCVGPNRKIKIGLSIEPSLVFIHCKRLAHMTSSPVPYLDRDQLMWVNLAVTPSAQGEQIFFSIIAKLAPLR